MNAKFLKNLPLLMASLGLYAAAEKRADLMNTPQDCRELCFAGPRLNCDEYWDLSAAAIYFEARAQGVDVGLTTQDPTNNEWPVNGNGIQVPESMSWGFKVGLGYKFFREDWKLAGRYTYFNNVTNEPLITAYGTAIIPSAYANQIVSAPTNLWGSPLLVGGVNMTNLLFQNLEMGNRTTVNNAQFLVVRPTLVDKKLELSTFYGIDLTFITRRTLSIFTNTYGASETGYFDSENGGYYQNYQKYNWWGVGPMVGAHTNYFVGYDISVYGDVYGSINYGCSSCRVATFSRHDIGAPTGNDSLEAIIDNKLYQFAPEVSYQIGLSWSKVVEDNSMMFGLNVGYEATYFFNVMKTITPDVAYRIEDGAGLGLQGLVLQGFVEF